MKLYSNNDKYKLYLGNMLDMLKIKELPTGMIIWYGNDILGITGATLPEKYYEYYCLKLQGNKFDYMLIEKVGDENE